MPDVKPTIPDDFVEICCDNKGHSKLLKNGVEYAGKADKEGFFHFLVPQDYAASLCCNGDMFYLVGRADEIVGSRRVGLYMKDFTVYRHYYKVQTDGKVKWFKSEIQESK